MSFQNEIQEQTSEKIGKSVSGAAGFEEMMAAVEKMLVEMEGQKLSLDEQVQNYEKGMRLIAECSRCLTEARNRISEVYNSSQAGKERVLRERSYAPDNGSDPSNGQAH